MLMQQVVFHDCSWGSNLARAPGIQKPAWQDHLVPLRALSSATSLDLSLESQACFAWPSPLRTPIEWRQSYSLKKSTLQRVLKCLWARYCDLALAFCMECYAATARVVLSCSLLCSYCYCYCCYCCSCCYYCPLIIIFFFLLVETADFLFDWWLLDVTVQVACAISPFPGAWGMTGLLALRVQYLFIIDAISMAREAHKRDRVFHV